MAAPNWKVKKDISYGSDQQEKLDLYLLNNGGSDAVIVLIHGGGWGARDKSAATVGAAGSGFSTCGESKNRSGKRTARRRAPERKVPCGMYKN